MTGEFAQLVTRHRKEGPAIVGTLLSFDPGETTGYAVFQVSTESGIELTEQGQLRTNDMEVGPKVLNETIVRVKPALVVFEDYKVYGWKTDQHAWSGLHTPRLIGALETLLGVVHGIPFHKQMAHVAKGFCTDEKLTQWGYYAKGQRHARDAVRHACYYILFGGQTK